MSRWDQLQCTCRHGHPAVAPLGRALAGDGEHPMRHTRTEISSWVQRRRCARRIALLAAPHSQARVASNGCCGLQGAERLPRRVFGLLHDDSSTRLEAECIVNCGRNQVSTQQVAPMHGLRPEPRPGPQPGGHQHAAPVGPPRPRMIRKKYRLAYRVDS